jgi:hypothetical protein
VAADSTTASSTADDRMMSFQRIDPVSSPLTLPKIKRTDRCSNKIAASRYDSNMIVLSKFDYKVQNKILN